MNVHDFVLLSGYVSKDKFLRGRTIEEMERILGYRQGRFRAGIAVARLGRLPLLSEFELAAYSLTAEHRYRQPGGLNIAKLKEMALASWSLTGLESLVKVLVNTPHDPGADSDWQYPPGSGAPQWKLTVKLPGSVVDVINAYPGGRYQRFV